MEIDLEIWNQTSTNERISVHSAVKFRKEFAPLTLIINVYLYKF